MRESTVVVGTPHSRLVLRAGEEDFVVAKTADAALEKARAKSGNADPHGGALRQDEDVMDTWFSSWLCPSKCLMVEDGGRGELLLPDRRPRDAPEIMFFWVARMITAGYEYRGQEPFKNVYYTASFATSKDARCPRASGTARTPSSS